MAGSLLKQEDRKSIARLAEEYEAKKLGNTKNLKQPPAENVGKSLNPRIISQSIAAKSVQKRGTGKI